MITQMKALVLFFFLCLLGCDSEKSKQSGNYPLGMSINDIVSTNDCTLSECSNERIVRLIAKNVVGTIEMTLDSQWVINYPYTFDSSINLYLCDLPNEFKVNLLDVIYDGKAIDACGIRTAEWPIEEVYTLVLTKIERQ